MQGKREWGKILTQLKVKAYSTKKGRGANSLPFEVLFIIDLPQILVWLESDQHYASGPFEITVKSGQNHGSRMTFMFLSV